MIAKRSKLTLVAILSGLLLFMLVGIFCFIKIDIFNNESTAEYLTRQIIKEAVSDDILIFKNKNNDDIQKQATERKEYVLQLMQKSPSEFLEIALSANLVDNYFSEINNIERKITIDGTLEIMFADSADGELVGTYYNLKTDNQTYSLYFADELIANELVSGSTISVAGYELDGLLVPDSLNEETPITVLNEFSTFSNVIPNRKVAVLMVNYDSVVANQPETASDWINIMTDAQAWFEEASYGQVSTSGINNPYIDVFGYYTVTLGACGTQIPSWTSQALAEAIRIDGFNEKNYDHVFYALPRFYSDVVGCSSPWSGVAMGTVNGSGIVFNGFPTFRTTVHEMGHNLGFKHARLATCYDENNNVVQASDNCTYEEYGDAQDIMGTSPDMPFQGFSKYGIGWIQESNRVTVNQSGTYTIKTLDTYTDDPQLLYIPIFYENSGGSSVEFNYYIDYRTWDSTNKVVIRKATRLGEFTDKYADLGAGGVYLDTIRKIEIEVLSVDNTEAVIQIKLGEHNVVQCAKRLPTITGQNGAGRNEYEITVTNNDSESCVSSIFSINYEFSNPGIFSTASFPITRQATINPQDSWTLSTGVRVILSSVPNDTYVITAKINNITTGEFYGTYYFPFVVSSNSTTCNRSLPNISLTPVKNNGSAGETLEYDLTIESTDASNCLTAQMTAELILPDGFSSRTDTLIDVRLDATDTFSTTIDLTSPSNQSDGVFPLIIKIKNLNYSLDSYVSTSALYLIGDATNPPTKSSSPNIEASINSYLSYSISSEKVSINTSPSSSNFASNNMSVNVSTNNKIGYVLQMNSSIDNLNSNSLTSDNNTDTIPSIINTTAGQAEALQNNTWGYNLGNPDINTFLTIPLANNPSTIADIHEPILNDITTIVFGVKTSPLTSAGIYNNIITYTILARI